MNIRIRRRAMKKSNNSFLQFLPYIKYSKREYFIGLLLATLDIGFSIIGTYVLSLVFDGIGGSITRQIFLKALTIAIGYGIILLISGILHYFMTIFLVRGANKIYVSIQTKIYDHIQSLPIKYFDNMPAGSVVSRMTNDANLIRNFFSSTFLQILVIVLKIVFIYGVLFTIDYRFASAMVLMLVCLTVFTLFYSKLAEPIYTNYRKESTLGNAKVTEGFQNLEIIKAFNKENDVVLEWDKVNKKRHSEYIKINRLDSLMMHNVTGLIRILLFVCIIYYYAYSHFNGVYNVTVGMVYLFINYSNNIIYSIADFAMGISAYSRAVGASNNINEILKLEVEHDIEGEETDDFRGNIRFEDVYFSYKDDFYVLRDLNISIEENQTVAFVGATGSGKSTIMNLLVKFYEVTKGTLYVSGKDITQYSREYLREKISIVLQDAFLFEGSLLENISENQDRVLAENALRSVGGGFILDSGRSLDSKVETGGKNFSTGEKQLICLARALSKNPKILILDESTANIDSETEQMVAEAIDKVKEGRTTLVIAHRLSTIKNADMIYVLHKGKVVEQGNHQTLLERGERYYKMYQSQING